MTNASNNVIFLKDYYNKLTRQTSDLAVDAKDFPHPTHDIIFADGTVITFEEVEKIADSFLKSLDPQPN